MTQRRIPVFTDDPGWHGKRLASAFEKRGYQAEFVTLKACRMELGDGPARIFIPGFEKDLPAGVFVRGVPGGSLQQVIFRLGILHALKTMGVAVYNDAGAIERTVDKSMTSFLLHRAQVPTPATWVCESRQQAYEIFVRETMAGHTLVIKPLFGSQGNGVRKLEPDLPFPVPMQEHVDGLYYLQSYIDSGEGAWHDYRVFVIDGKLVGAMVRRGSHWINNVALGGRCEAVPKDKLSDEIVELALAAARAVGIDYCGVDVIRDRQGKCYVLEVNGIPAWKGLQGVAETDIGQALVDNFIAKIEITRNRLSLVS